MKLQIYDLEGFTTCSENNGADHLCCYHRLSHDAAQFLFSQLLRTGNMIECTIVFVYFANKCPLLILQSEILHFMKV